MNNELDNKEIVQEAASSEETVQTVQNATSTEETVQTAQNATSSEETVQAAQEATSTGETVQTAQTEPVKKYTKKMPGAYTEYGSPEKRPTWIRVVCIIAVVLLIGLIIATLIVAISGGSKETVMALILCDGIIPIFIWVFLKITQKSLDRRKEAEKYYGQNKN